MKALADQWQGLSVETARARLESHGPNQLPAARPKNIFRIAREVMSEPMFLLLVACGIVYVLLGDYEEGLILSVAIFVIIGITFYQYQKTERALEALKKLSSPRALVIRDGQEMRIPGTEVVPGDILVLNEGDRIAADARLKETAHLEVDESFLTGESVPIGKRLGGDPDEVDRNTLLYSGSLVVRGMAVAEVTHTGPRTEIGKIGKSLQEIDPGKTRLQKETKKLIRNLAIGGILISLLVIVLFYLRRGDFLMAVLNGLASAMAILPEEFPVVMTVFIALGAWRLSRKKVLTRKPATIETLGSTTVLCTDKTGTLTQNTMEVVSIYFNNRVFDRKEIREDAGRYRQLLQVAAQACIEGSVDPMEMAIRDAARYERPPTAEVVREYPLSRELMAMTVVYRDRETGSAYASCKGAPESVFALCHMQEDQKQHLMEVVRQLAAKGLRVLGVAEVAAVPDPLPAAQHAFEYQFAGLIGLEDPVRPEVPEAIGQCRKAGIQVVMITGDFPVTAESIASQIGLPAQQSTLTGENLKQLSEIELKECISRTHVIARAVPEQKLRIVQALQSNGEVVAMTGDGVNDAPALKAADIGVAMGNKGTDVARESASLVLLDDHFASIVMGIRMGRRIFDNLQKAMTYILSVHVPIIGLALLPALLSDVPVLLFPVHIVFMELIIDPVCSIAFEAEEEEKGIMDRPPRSRDEVFFSMSRVLYSLFQGFLLLVIVLAVYFLTLGRGLPDMEVRAITFTALIIGNVFLIMSNLSATRSFLHVLASRNLAVKIILGGALATLALINLTPALRNVFSFAYPGGQAMLPAIAGGFILLLVLEGIKWLRNHAKN